MFGWFKKNKNKTNVRTINVKENKPSQRKPINLELQVQKLAECDIKLINEEYIDELVQEHSRDYFEEKPYFKLLSAYGSYRHAGDENAINFSNDVWNFDFEYIFSDGDYASIASDIERLTKGDLALENIKDNIDYKNKNAWLEFTHKSKQYHWDFEVNRDWTDSKVFSLFANLIKKLKTGKTLVEVDTGGKNGIFFYMSDQQIEKFQTLTGLKIYKL